MGLDPEIAAHYDQGVERDRLSTWGRLEAERTRELLRRFLPRPPAVVLDIGGAAARRCCERSSASRRSRACSARPRI